MSTSYPPHYAYPSAPPLQRALPKPPRLHWGWVLALNIITRGLFGSVWLFVQANWIRRMVGRSAGYWLALANMIWLPLTFFAGVSAVMLAHFAHTQPDVLIGPLTILLVGGIAVLYVATVFTMRSELQGSVIGMSLGAVMTLLFAPYYFQFHLRDYDEPYSPEGIGLGLTARTVVIEPTQPEMYPSAESVGVVYPRTPLPTEPPSA